MPHQTNYAAQMNTLQSNSDISNDLDATLTRFSRSRHFWSRISQKRCFL